MHPPLLCSSFIPSLSPASPSPPPPCSGTIHHNAQRHRHELSPYPSAPAAATLPSMRGIRAETTVHPVVVVGPRRSLLPIALSRIHKQPPGHHQYSVASPPPGTSVPHHCASQPHFPRAATMSRYAVTPSSRPLFTPNLLRTPLCTPVHLLTWPPPPPCLGTR